MSQNVTKMKISLRKSQSPMFCHPHILFGTTLNSSINTDKSSEEPSVNYFHTDNHTTFSIVIEDNLKYFIDLKKGENSLKLNFYKVTDSFKEPSTTPKVLLNINSNVILLDVEGINASYDKSETRTEPNSMQISPIEYPIQNFEEHITVRKKPPLREGGGIGFFMVFLRIFFAI